MSKSALEIIATTASLTILVAACWYLSIQIQDTLEFLEMAYG